MSWFLGITGGWLIIIALIVIGWIIGESDNVETLNERWLGSLFVAVTIVLGTGCIACSASHPETMTDDEHKVLMEYRLQQKQKALAKELSELNKGDSNVDARGK